MNNICNYCNRDFKNPGGLASHMRSCKLNPNRNPWKNEGNTNSFVKGNIPWNTGKKLNKPAWNKGLKGLKGTPHTAETKKKLSELAKLNGNGGYRRGSGRGKGSWYKSKTAGTVYLDSSWELKYCKWLDENSINWKRNSLRFPYKYKGKVKNYIPDFYLIDEDTYIEVKGYKTDKDDAKWKYFPNELKVLYGNDLLQLGISI